MTTIVYDHSNKTIAYDSRECCNYILTDDCDKHEQQDGVDFFCCGVVNDIEILKEMYLTGGQYTGGKLSASGFVVDEGYIFYVTVDEDGILNKTLLEFSMSIGSGGEWALAALDMGKSAKEAVEYAMTRDYHSGGLVREFKVE